MTVEFEQRDPTAVDAMIHEAADVHPSAAVGQGCSVWHLAQIREGAQLGKHCVVGRGAYIGAGVSLGDGCKIQNYALVYEPARLGRGVFVGPAVVFTNDHFPRAVNPDLSIKSASDWTAVGVTVLDGASIGARAVLVAPVTVGRWALVGAGAVVVRDVPDYALVAGVPATRRGWVGPAGVPLEAEAVNNFRCPSSGRKYRQTAENTLVEVQ